VPGSRITSAGPSIRPGKQSDVGNDEQDVAGPGHRRGRVCRGVATLLSFDGFIVIDETWFEMSRSDLLPDLSLQSALRYGAMVALIALDVGCLDDPSVEH